MARTATTKATEVKSTAKTEEKTADAIVKTEDNSEILSKENAELKEQLAKLMVMVNELKSAQPKEVIPEETINASIIYDDIDIPESKSILVVSLSDGDVYLHNGDGRTFHFDRFGARRQIVYRDLLGIISTDRQFIEDGVVYICDKDVVRANYLEDKYQNFITLEKITNILSFSVEEIADMVAKTTKPIQETIISYIVEKVKNGEYVDRNKLAAIENAVEPKCDIQALALAMRNK